MVGTRNAKGLNDGRGVAILRNRSPECARASIQLVCAIGPGF